MGFFRRPGSNVHSLPNAPTSDEGSRINTNGNGTYTLKKEDAPLQTETKIDTSTSTPAPQPSAKELAEKNEKMRLARMKRFAPPKPIQNPAAAIDAVITTDSPRPTAK